MKKAQSICAPKVPAWTAVELNLHKQAAQKLEKIIKQALVFLKQNKFCTEERLYNFIIEKIAKSGMTSMLGWTIVAYGPSAADPHYRFHPGRSRVIKKGHLLLLDIWGKINKPNAPYADITHMYFLGEKPPALYTKLWNELCNIRENTLTLLKNNHTILGSHLYKISKKQLDKHRDFGLFLHGLGHDLGCDHVHGPGANLSKKCARPLIPGRGYTIEPGIYKKGSFGMRSEINIFIDKKNKVHLTTRVQNKLECI